jgi:hypothetical protein
MYFRFANGIVEKIAKGTAKKIAERIAKKPLMYVRFVKVERIAQKIAK